MSVSDSPIALEKSSIFVDLKALVPSLEVDLKYATHDNFVGEAISGYEHLECWLTEPAAMAVMRVQHALAEFGLGLIVFDAYRPQRAVDYFLEWSATQGNEVNKAQYYPCLEKTALFGDGYLIAQSSHSRGSTLDVSLIDLDTKELLDMGTCFDYFGPESWLNALGISAQARANRMLLQCAMCAQGFLPFDKEWWHFTLANEPFPNSYFDFID